MNVLHILKKRMQYLGIFSFIALNCMPIAVADDKCIPLKSEDLLTVECTPAGIPDNLSDCNISVRLPEDFKGKLWLNKEFINDNGLKIKAITTDTVVELNPVIDSNQRVCSLVTDYKLNPKKLNKIFIPAGFFEISPDYIEVDDIDIDSESLSNLSVGGAWHKRGNNWNHQGMFSIIDDDSLDGQLINSSSPYGGYFSLLYPLLESLGLKGNLAVEGRRTGLTTYPPVLNDNMKTVKRLQDEKGWDILAHSMICLGEILNNWVVDSLSSDLAKEILAAGPNNGEDASTVSVYDLQTKKQYWPNSDNTAWGETPSIFIKPYAGDYKTKREILFNPDYDFDWHWGEWKRRAIELGIDPKGYVTHNSTSSHAFVGGILKYYTQGFSDLSTKNINTAPMLSSAVRAGLEGQSLKDYRGENDDNTFNTEHFKAFCSLIDEAAECGGWIMFNLHAYRACWRNTLPGALVSEGGTYPDEWVIPMKGVNSVNDPLSPPEKLGISDWSEWHPCPGTRLDMMWQVLKYAIEKRLVNVTSSKGFDIIGNKQASGYFNNGYVFGMDTYRINGTRSIYPHYIVSATDEVFYYNHIISEEITHVVNEENSTEMIGDEEDGKFLRIGDKVVWNATDYAGTSLKVFDLTGKELMSTHLNEVTFDKANQGTYIICAFRQNSIVNTIKVII